MGTKVATITVKGAHNGFFPQAKALVGIVDTGALPPA
jgi:hypothetical protein